MDIWSVEGFKYLTFDVSALLKRDKEAEVSKVLSLTQLGEEVNFMGLPALFNIELGSNLEQDERFRPKAAMLAGFFEEILAMFLKNSISLKENSVWKMKI